MSEERDEPSSATEAQPVVPRAAKPAAAEPRAASGATPPWLLAAAPLVALGAAVAGGQVYGPPGVVLVLAGVALVAVVALFWQSLRTLLGETPLSGADAYALGAPRTEEEQKRAVLRALKDLEFERAVGKISDDDYKQLVVHYRKEAKRLLRVIDEQNAPQRAKAAALADARLAKLGLTAETAKGEAPRAEDAAAHEADAAAEDALAEGAPAEAKTDDAEGVPAEAKSDDAEGAPAEAKTDDAEAKPEEAAHG